MKYALSDFTLAIEMVMRLKEGKEKLRAVTVFCNPKNPAKTRRVRASTHGSKSIMVTYGKPNYKERMFLCLCQRAKTKPKKIWIQYKRKK